MLYPWVWFRTPLCSILGLNSSTLALELCGEWRTPFVSFPQNAILHPLCFWLGSIRWHTRGVILVIVKWVRAHFLFRRNAQRIPCVYASSMMGILHEPPDREPCLPIANLKGVGTFRVCINLGNVGWAYKNPWTNSRCVYTIESVNLGSHTLCVVKELGHSSSRNQFYGHPVCLGNI